MSAQQRSIVSLGSIILAVIFLIIGILYWTGNNPMQSGTHHKYGVVFFVLTIAALGVAYVNRPGAEVRE